MLLFVVIFIAGCSTVKPVEVQTTATERQPLGLETPPPLTPNVVEWVVITPDNIETKFSQLGEPKVLFGITPEEYERLSFNAVKTRNLISSLRQIIEKYKQYYEPNQSER